MHSLGQQRQRDIWGMYPVTNWIVEVRPDHMEADAAYFDQAQQGLMLGQPYMPAPQLPVSQLPAPGQQQTVPVGLTTEWEIEERRKFTTAPSIEWGGVRLAQVPIVVAPNDELEKRVGIMQAHPFDNPGLFPVKMSGAFLGQVPVRGMGQFTVRANTNTNWPELVARAVAQRKAAEEAADRAAAARAAALTQEQRDRAEDALEAAAEAQCEAAHAHAALQKKDVDTAEAHRQASLVAVQKANAFVDQATPVAPPTSPSGAPPAPSAAPAASSGPTTASLAIGGGLLAVGGIVLYSILK